MQWSQDGIKIRQSYFYCPNNKQRPMDNTINRMFLLVLVAGTAFVLFYVS